ncbi:YitT family protein [Paenibacillus sp. y28]|uniref:YitT family protein n=1 Tax=Paenibacillus sp. y28 TaxID=3129110 RepID=UPI0030195575
MRIRWAARVKTAVPIFIGTALYAFGLHFFIIPNELMEGGITGVALLLNYAYRLPPSITTLLINIPLFVFGYYKLGLRAMGYTIFGTLSLSFCLWIMELLLAHGQFKPFYASEDMFLAALYAGISLGAGLGLVFRFGGTTGGSDIVARILQHGQGFSMGRTILFIDALIIGISLFFVPVEKVLYTLVSVFVASKIIDSATEGPYAAKAFMIMTDSAPEIAVRITRELDRGATLFTAKGAFSGEQKEVVYCVIYRNEMRRLKTLVHQLDPKAFMIINDVHSVVGEGFRGK